MAANLQTAHVGQVDIEEDELWLLAFGGGQGRRSVGGIEHPEPIIFQRDPHQFDDVRLVLDDQHRNHDADVRQGPCPRPRADLTQS